MTDDHFERSKKSKNDEARAREIWNSLEADWDSSDFNVDLIVVALAQARAEQREADAKVLTDEVAEHRAQHGEHQYCEDYGCHYLETLAATIRKGV